MSESWCERRTVLGTERGSRQVGAARLELATFRPPAERANSGGALAPLPISIAVNGRKGLPRKSVFLFPGSIRRARYCGGAIENPPLHGAAVLQVGGAARWVGDGSSGRTTE